MDKIITTLEELERFMDRCYDESKSTARDGELAAATIRALWEERDRLCGALKAAVEIMHLLFDSLNSAEHSQLAAYSWEEYYWAGPETASIREALEKSRLAQSAKD